MGELEAIRARHVPSPAHRLCRWEHDTWPCDTAVALAEVERLRAMVRFCGACGAKLKPISELEAGDG